MTNAEDITRLRRAKTEEIVAKYQKITPPIIPAVGNREKPRLTVDFGSSPIELILERDELYMSAALELAALASELGEVPVGALIVRGSDIIAADFNGRETVKSALYHAETAVIASACSVLGGWRLPGCELFVTLEPCVMCAGAIVSARIPRVVYGASDPKAGAYGGKFDLRDAGLNHTPTVIPGIKGEEASRQLRNFFTERRR